MRARLSAVVALGGFGTAVLLLLVVSPLFEAVLWAAVAAVIGGFAAGLTLGFVRPGLPRFDYTAAGAVPLFVAFGSLVALHDRPAGGLAAAVFGTGGAALVGLDIGLKYGDSTAATDDDATASPAATVGDER